MVVYDCCAMRCLCLCVMGVLSVARRVCLVCVWCVVCVVCACDVLCAGDAVCRVWSVVCVLCV